MEITQQIQEVLQKHLPQMQANELKTFIEEANANKSALEETKKKYEHSIRQIEQLNLTKNTWENASRLKAEAEAKLDSAIAKERKYDLDIKDTEIKQQKFVIDSFKEFLLLLVKNPRAIEIMNETRNIPIFEPYSGGGGHHTTRSENTYGSKESTETKE